MNLPLNNQKKNAFITLRTTTKIKEDFIKSISQRYYPSPKDPNVRLAFSSVNDYLEYVVSRISRAGSKTWYLLAYLDFDMEA